MRKGPKDPYLHSLIYNLDSDVGLRPTCAYYRTSARAMRVQKCVRKGSGTVRAKVRAYGQFFKVRFTMHLEPIFTFQVKNKGYRYQCTNIIKLCIEKAVTK